MEQPRPRPEGDLEGQVYEQLRAIAARQMQNERAGHTLTATALVHEAYAKMAVSRDVGPEAEALFYHAAARAMRRVLIDHARRRGAAKRGSRERRAVVVESVLDLAREDHVDDVLALDEAIVRLEEEDGEAAAVVRLRFFGGLTGDRAAEVMGISARQVDRAWAFARAFLARELRGGG